MTLLERRYENIKRVIGVLPPTNENENEEIIEEKNVIEVPSLDKQLATIKNDGSKSDELNKLDLELGDLYNKLGDVFEDYAEIVTDSGKSRDIEALSTLVDKMLAVKKLNKDIIVEKYKTDKKIEQSQQTNIQTQQNVIVKSTRELNDLIDDNDI